MNVDVRMVTNKHLLRAFLRLPRHIYKLDIYWVPPLPMTAKIAIDTKRNPFYEHARIRLFIACRNKRPVGRIAAIINTLHNEYHQDRVGFWGFFETENRLETAKVLFEAVRNELRAQGMTQMWGPFNPSVNSECGLLVDGFDSPPVIMMPYNPSYYVTLLEELGHTPLRELSAYNIEKQFVEPENETMQRLEKLATAARARRPNLVVRTLDMTRYEEEVGGLVELFNIVRARNWGFVPSTEHETRFLAKEMRPVVRPECVIVAQYMGKTIGCIMSIPDINEILKKLDGKLFPFGWFHLLRHKSTVRRLRIFGIGVLPNYRTLGVIPLMLMKLIKNNQRCGYAGAELSWVASDNVSSMRMIMNAVKPTLYKRYMVYSHGI